MILCGCMLTGMAGCTGETASDGGQVTNIPVEDLADGDLPVETPEGMSAETVDLMDGIELMSTEWSDNFPDHPITKFGVPLLQNTLKQAKKGDNILISPMSAWTVLCMVEAGANGETKQQTGGSGNYGGGLSYLRKEVCFPASGK